LSAGSLNESTFTRRVILLIGSNIEPIKNIRHAIKEIKSCFPIDAYSSIWETKPVGTSGDNFLNLALAISTDMDYDSLKFGLLRSIEAKYGRLRTTERSTPRTLDIDIILDGDIIREENLWDCLYVAVPVAEIIPNLLDPITHKTLTETAKELIKNSWIIKYPADI
jgi:2-amino-4-hydroxy-6-hydroxymethyldihydropteridine diphosphokinase